MASSASGTCLCGSITLSTQSLPEHVGACHCSICSTWGGGPLFAVNCRDDVIIDDESKLKRFASSAWAERGFCSQCGTHLFCRLKPSNTYLVPAGLFDKAKLEFNHQIYIDEKPSYYNFANTTRNMTGAEVAAQFANND